MAGEAAAAAVAPLAGAVARLLWSRCKRGRGVRGESGRVRGKRVPGEVRGRHTGGGEASGVGVIVYGHIWSSASGVMCYQSVLQLFSAVHNLALGIVLYCSVFLLYFLRFTGHLTRVQVQGILYICSVQYTIL